MNGSLAPFSITTKWTSCAINPTSLKTVSGSLTTIKNYIGVYWGTVSDPSVGLSESLFLQFALCFPFVSLLSRLIMSYLTWVLKSVCCTRPESCSPAWCHGRRSLRSRLDSGLVLIEAALRLIWAELCWRQRPLSELALLCPASPWALRVELCWKVKDFINQFTSYYEFV